MFSARISFPITNFDVEQLTDLAQDLLATWYKNGQILSNYLSEEPPVRCLGCFDPVPLYRLPHIHDEEHQR